MRKGRWRLAIVVVAAMMIAAIVVWPPTDGAEAVAVEDATVPDPADRPLAVRIWYPATATAGKLPLIVVSHGTGGGNRSHVDTAEALARAGFVVAAVTHTGDNYRDESYIRRNLHLIGRPRHVSRVIDYMLRQWRGRIDPARIGFFGHSAGGFTGLVVAGGEPDMSRAAAYCRQHPQNWGCRYVRRHGLDPDRIASDQAWHHDARVKAAVIAAPAVGYAFEPDRLAAVTIPLQLWDAEYDPIVDDSPSRVKRLLATPPDYRRVAGAGHFSFLEPCGWRFRAFIAVLALRGTEPICTDPEGFDRADFHRDFNREVVGFFRKTLR